jgi:glycosyltransferase involved in cell wall biosynthesis
MTETIPALVQTPLLERRNLYDLTAPMARWVRWLAPLRRLGIRLGRAVLERAVFAHTVTLLATPLRWCVVRWFAADIRDLTPDFEPAIYLGQVRSPLRRRRAAMAPLLHYRLTGWREFKAPNAAFDPTFYREQSGLAPGQMEPLLHYLRVGQALGYARNGTERSASANPAGALETLLVLQHSRGGGSGRWLDTLEADARQAGRAVVRLRPINGMPHWVVADAWPGRPSFDLAAAPDIARLAAVARASGVAAILVNHVIDQEVSIFAAIPELARLAGIPFDVVLHDYYIVCPRVDGVQGDGRFCGIAAVEVCRGCLAQHSSEAGRVDPAAWRQAGLALLRAARRVTVPSSDLARRLHGHLPGVALTITAPELDAAYPPEAMPRVQPSEPLHVVTVGALNIPKGAEVVLGLAAAIRRAGAPLRLTVLGPTPYAAELRQYGVHVHGRYREADLGDLLAEVAPDIVLLPAIWPETWSFVLTHVLRAGLPVVTFDVGAPAERLRRHGRGRILPLEYATMPDAVLQDLLALRAEALVTEPL